MERPQCGQREGIDMKSYIVEKAALEQNCRILLEKAKGKTVWGVVKGDGYGLGCAQLAKYLSAYGIDHFAVTDIADVRALRAAGFAQNPILMMEGTSDAEEIHQLLDLNVIFSVGSEGAARALNEQALARSTVAQAHIKIDTGMGRFGFHPEQMEKIHSLFRENDGIAFTGIYTHFYAAYSPADTQAQFDKFQAVVQELQAAGIETGMVHCCNSTAFWKYEHMHCDAVRLGSALLGRVGFAGKAGLKSVGYCRAQIEELRTLPAGHNVGYTKGYTTKTETRIAVLGVGYINGFAVDRGFDTWSFKDCVRGVARYIKAFLKKKALYVQVGGKNCRVLGHVGMVNMVVDVSGVECAVGDFATVAINPLLLKGMDVEFV